MPERDVAFPGPGSESKKYSAWIIFCPFAKLMQRKSRQNVNNGFIRPALSRLNNDLDFISHSYVPPG
jgi:hypothetical protein